MRWLWLCGVLFALFTLPVAAQTETQSAEELYRQQLEASGADRLGGALPADVQELLSELELDGLDPSGYTQLSVSRVTELLSGLLARESGGPLRTFGVLLGIVLLAALFSGLEGTAENRALRQTYHGVAVLGAGGALLVPLFALLETVRQTVEQVTVFLIAYVPVYAAILATGGRAGSALSYQTTLLGASQLLTWLVGGVVFPVLTVSLAMGCTGAVAEGFCLESFSQTLHKAVLWVLGLFSTAFSGLLSLQQMVTAAGDTLGNRVMKFSLSSFVPVVGGLLSEAYSTVVGCAGLLRTTVGVFGLIAVVLVILPPLFSCICWSVSLYLASSAAALFGLTPLEKLCRLVAGGVRVLIAVLAVFALLMVVSTSVIVFTAGR